MGPSASNPIRHGDVVALRLPPGPAWLELLRATWEAGAALAPVDHRLGERPAAALLSRIRPTLVHGGGGWTRPDGGGSAEEGVALVVATSGTGADPKLVQLDRTAVGAAVEGSSLALGAGPEDGWLACLPPAHVGGLLVLLRSVLLGAPVEVHPAFDPGIFARRHGAAFTSLVPTMLFRLLGAGVDLSAFRAILVGGASIWEQTRQSAVAAGARVVATYGLTESCGGVAYDGRPFKGTRIRVEPTTSEIELTGPTLMRGYRFDPVATAAAFTPDGWLRTGDAGELLPGGELRVLGRLDDLIRTGGEKVWPEEVERALASHAKVADVAVAGRPDPEWGQRVVAFVVPRDPADPPTLEELRDHVSRTLARYQAPRELMLTDALPRNASGKLRRVARGSWAPWIPGRA